jgi:hypothetical protein
MREVDRLHPEERIEDDVRLVQLHEPGIRQHPSHLVREIVELLQFEVVEDRKATLEQVGAKRGGFAVGHLPIARFPHEGDRIPEQLGII